MKLFINIILTILVSLSASSCRYSDLSAPQEPTYPAKEAVRVSSGFSVDTLTRTTLNEREISWTTGDEIGVFSPQASTKSNSYTEVKNIVMIAQNSSTSTLFSGSLYWGNNNKHSFYAYYPFKTGDFAATAIPVALYGKQTQSYNSSSSHISHMDFSVATPIVELDPVPNAASSALVDFKFSHLFALVEVRVIGSTNEYIGSITVASSNRNQRLAFQNATVDITQSPAQITYSNQAGDNFHYVKLITVGNPTQDYATTPSHYMLLSPVDLSSDTLVVGTATKYNFVKGFNFEAGKKYIVQFDLRTSFNGDPANFNVYEPQVATYEAINVTSDYANVGVNISNIGSPALTEYGLCYGTSPWPTIDNDKYSYTTSNAVVGNTLVALCGLSDKTKYYVRSYAKNRLGVVYGNEVSFTTGDISNKVITTVAGSLGTAIEAAGLKDAAMLVVSGPLNKTDYIYLRDKMPNLAVLDLKATTVEAQTLSGYLYSANEFPAKAFYNGSVSKLTLRKVIMPSTITSIGLNAFQGCSGLLGSVEIPPGVTNIKDYAFGQCINISGSLNLPSSLETIGNYAFLGCKNLSGTLVIPNTVKSIGASAFANCLNFTGELAIPSEVTEITTGTFSNCRGLTSLKLHDNIKVIFTRAFENCTSLTVLKLPANLITIGDSAFENCTNLTGTIDIPVSVQILYSYIFNSCSKIERIDLNWSIVTVGYSSYFWSSNIPIYIPRYTKANYTAKGWPSSIIER